MHVPSSCEEVEEHEVLAEVMNYMFLFSRSEAEVKGDINRSIQVVDKDDVHFPLGQPVATSLNVLRLS